MEQELESTRETWKAAYRVLSRMRSALEPVTKRTFSQEELHPMQIDCSTVPLDKDTEFCSLCPQETLDRAFDDITSEEKSLYKLCGDDGEWGINFYSALPVGRQLYDYFCLDHLDWQRPGIPKWLSVGASSRKLTFHRHCYPDSTCSPWGLIQIFYTSHPGQSHHGCLFLDDAPAEDDLRPSELWVAITLIKQVMRLDKNFNNSIHPVFVYSIAGRKARILQVYLDKTHRLNVKKTPYVDFQNENQINLKQYLRWMVGTSIGVTTDSMGVSAAMG